MTSEFFAKILIILIRLYQILISPLFAPVAVFILPVPSTQ
jgi:putative component of membrane protein insertase Oxa1/YidC/SpoIIIJ protein YidD